jgi:hypothetical protein
VRGAARNRAVLDVAVVLFAFVFVVRAVVVRVVVAVAVVARSVVGVLPLMMGSVVSVLPQVMVSFVAERVVGACARTTEAPLTRSAATTATEAGRRRIIAGA